MFAKKIVQYLFVGSYIIFIEQNIMKVKFISLASGSSGNCYYIGTESYGILIDAGIAARTIKKTLKEFGIGIDTIIGVFVTHEQYGHC
jgi:Metal-dependent hydrolases of the beta-lactamase superfamily I